MADHVRHDGMMTFYEFVIIDEVVRSPKSFFSVIPAKAGIQSFQWLSDAGSSQA